MVVGTKWVLKEGLVEYECQVNLKTVCIFIFFFLPKLDKCFKLITFDFLSVYHKEKIVD